MIDVLTLTRDARLAVVELKADEEIHLPLQGLDYWARVQWHHGRGVSEVWIFWWAGVVDGGAAAFSGRACLACAPGEDVILRHISPEIEWAFVGIDERWREGVRVGFRKRAQRDAVGPRRKVGLSRPGTPVGGGYGGVCRTVLRRALRLRLRISSCWSVAVLSSLFFSLQFESAYLRTSAQSHAPSRRRTSTSWATW